MASGEGVENTEVAGPSTAAMSRKRMRAATPIRAAENTALQAALQEIHQLRQEQRQQRADLEELLQQRDEEIPQANGWNDALQTVALASNLRGRARSVLDGVFEIESLSFGELKSKLELRFGEGHLAHTYYTQFTNRKQKLSGDLPTLASGLERLSRLAYPEYSHENEDVGAESPAPVGTSTGDGELILIIEANEAAEAEGVTEEVWARKFWRAQRATDNGGLQRLDTSCCCKKRRLKNFQHSWLDENDFKGWLTPHPDIQNKALCTACNKAIKCCKTNLTAHSQTAKHIKNVTSSNFEATVSSNLSHKDKVKRAEIKLSAFFAEHNVAFYCAEHLTPLLKDICIEPKVVQDLSLARNKCANIVKNIIAKREVETIVQYLQTCKFSILIDESTDISDTKVMCLLVKYVLPVNKKLTTQLLELLPLDATDCSASKIFEIFKNFLEEKEIPIKNIVGMACDNAPVMIGCNNFFMSRLKVEVPELITLNCICHSSAIIASKACEKLPNFCESLIRGVATYISGSAKRCAVLGEFQDFFEIQQNKMLKLLETRWLCLHKCVVRLLDNWEVLKNYFILATLTFLDPKIALYYEGRLKIKDLTFIAKRVLKDIDITDLAFEWRILPSSFNEDRKKELASLQIDEM
ncbi:uncharacterized protein [Anoplolepis gracilipes]|uniref:uncharacterized protein n=1 Tax=Anoplolepis gracilipes TaxID=354296 RepID=UPI003BA15742